MENLEKMIKEKGIIFGMQEKKPDKKNKKRQDMN